MLLILGICVTGPPCVAGQAAFDAKELANYRLTLPVFTRFAHASRLIGAAIRQEPRFAADPLFTADLSVTGDAVEAATTLRTRLDNDATLSSALFAADISAHEYATFAVALIGARLAHGFLESGAMRRVPAGVAEDNVAFVRAHLGDVTAVLEQLGVD